MTVRAITRSSFVVIYINDLNQAMKFRKVHYLADDTNLLHFSKSVNNLNKHVT